MEPEAAPVEDEAQVDAPQESPPQQNPKDNQDDTEPMEQGQSAAVIQEESEAEPQVIFYWIWFILFLSICKKLGLYRFKLSFFFSYLKNNHDCVF